MAQADTDDVGRGTGRLTSAEKKDMAELRRRNRQLEVENEILKRAAAYFAGRTSSQIAFRLVAELADDGIDVAVSCRVLGVSRSGYYEWKDRPVSARDQENELLLRLIEKIHADPKMKSYGSPRMHAELTLGMGLQVNEKRVARLMRAAGIQGLYYRPRSLEIGFLLWGMAEEPA